MEIFYKNKKAEKQFDSTYESKWEYPEKVKIKLKSALSLNDVFVYPRLKGDRKGEWSITVPNTA